MAQSGSARAELSYIVMTDDSGFFQDFSDVRLKIIRGGQTLFDSPIAPACSACSVEPANYFPPTGASGATEPYKRSVQVIDLDESGEPQVLLDLFWGGAHCCWYSYIYRYTPSGYVALRHVWGDFSYRLQDLSHSGRQDFVTADDRFAYAFTSFADSSFPIQVWSYRSGRLIDVTRAFPIEVRADAAKQWRWYRRYLHHRSVRGFLGAWAADECLFHRCVQAFDQLHRLATRGLLTNKHYDAPITAASYLAKLKKLLRAFGYF